MPLLALKLTLVPLLIYIVSMSSKWWGPATAGWLAGPPLMAGPITALVIADRGVTYGSQAALYLVAGVAAADAFNTVFARWCRRHAWQVATLAGCASWVVAAVVVAMLPMNTALAVGIAGGSIAISFWLMPPVTVRPAPTLLTRRDLVLRMLAGVALTLFVTTAAAVAGPGWSGVLASFPLLGIILGVASLRSLGPEYAIAMARGLLLGRFTFAAFFLCLAWALPAWGVLPAFAASTGVALVVHGTSRRFI
jgi:hypothetical protein